MKDEHKKIKKQSYVSFFLSYCIYSYDIWLIHLLINEITQLGIITVYRTEGGISVHPWGAGAL